MERYKGQIKNYKWNIRKKRSHHGKEHNQAFCDDVLTFDIETTSAWINEHGNIIRYRPGRSGDYWNDLEAVTLCYIWQFSVNDKVYYGRELWEFYDLLRDLPADVNYIIWVHNLSFEFHFLQNIFEKMEVFARQPHKPMKMAAEDFPHIEWRCSYMLTRLSLDNWGKSLGVHKLTGWLDYRKIRTPLTQLTERELAYAERDCIVVYIGILDYLKRYKNQWDIPLTQTGTVRREVKRMLLSDARYHKRIKKLVPRNAKQYKMLQQIFAGGYTHANRLHAGVVQEGHIEHYDFTSHYPTMLIAHKYPCSPWAYIGKKFPKQYNPEDNAYIFHVKFTRIQSTKYNTYIQTIKAAIQSCPYRSADCRCKWRSPKYDNGRLIRAYQVEIWLTEQDFETIKESYIWDSMEMLGVWKSRKDYLPKDFIEYILELYGNKTSLKDVTEEEQPGAPALYGQSKQYINSLFGMAVTSLIQSDVCYNQVDKSWRIAALNEDMVNQRLEELRRWNPRERRYFLSYSWGCWCTAYARRMLWVNLLKYDSRVLYADTDSLFVLGKCDFTEYNDFITNKLQEALEHYDLDVELMRPKDPKERKRQLGIFLPEENCIQFLTLGAKRYVERREDGKLYLTVSGINKEAVYCLKDDILNFADGFVFDKDFGSVHKSLLTYVYEQQPLIWPDGYRSDCQYGINMRPNGYHLHMTDEYKNLIRYNKLDPVALPGKFKNHMRGRFTLDENK